LLQSVADGVGGGAHTPADLVDHLAAGLIAWLVPEPGDLRGASPTWATLAHAEMSTSSTRIRMHKLEYSLVSLDLGDDCVPNLRAGHSVPLETAVAEAAP
jgi:hypothetical protein